MRQSDPKVPEARAAANKPALASLGSAGPLQAGGMIREEYLRNLDGPSGRRIFEEMSRNDATCGGILFAIRNMLRSMKWEVVAAEAGDDSAEKMREIVENMLFYDMEHTWPDFIDSACSAFAYGFAIFAIDWKKRNGRDLNNRWQSSQFDDGLFAPASFRSIHQSTVYRWIFDDTGRALAFEQYPLDTASMIVPLPRCMHFRTTHEHENPEGVSLLRNAYRAWYWLKRLQEIEGIGTERDLAGYPVIRVPGPIMEAADPETIAAKNSYLAMLRQIRRDQNEGVLLSSDRDESGNLLYEFELLSSGGSRQMDIGASIDRYQKDIARSVAADFLFLGADGGGSLALGKTKIQFFVEALKAYSEHFAAQVNERVIADIWRFNGFDFDLMPMVIPGRIEEPDLAALGSYVTALSGVGFDMGTDVELENHLRREAAFPAAPDRTDDDDFTALPSGRQVSVSELLAQEQQQQIVDAGPPDPNADDEEVAKALRDRFGGNPSAGLLAGILEGFTDG